jgi:hypothetical protein
MNLSDANGYLVDWENTSVKEYYCYVKDNAGDDVSNMFDFLEKNELTTFKIKIQDSIVGSDGIHKSGTINYNYETNEVEILISKEGNCFDALVHEGNHGEQYLEGKIGFMVDGEGNSRMIGVDFCDEVEAYNMENKAMDFYNNHHSGADQLTKDPLSEAINSKSTDEEKVELLRNVSNYRNDAECGSKESLPNNGNTINSIQEGVTQGLIQAIKFYQNGVYYDFKK